MQMFHTFAPNPGVISLTLFFLGFLVLSRPALILFRSRSLRIRAYHASLFFFSLSVWYPAAEDFWRPLKISFISLGQGDCILIQTPSGKTMLVDGGPPVRFDDHSLLVEYLWTEGIKRIDVMVLTHPQADHIGSLESVVNHFPVGILLEGSTISETETYQSFIHAIKHNNIKRHNAIKGDSFSLDDETKVWVLHPDRIALAAEGDDNEKSIVLMVQYNEIDILLTGDIGLQTESRLCKKYDNWDVEILKVPHHGSRYASSDELLAETKPEIAIIQVGNNPYGHPHKDAMDRLENVNAHILKNNEDGTVEIVVRRDQVKISTTRSNRSYLYRNNDMSPRELR
jgi:competence protein ComEC